MSRYRKTPDAAQTADAKGSSNSLYPLYTTSQRRTQARLRKMYGISNAVAILAADVLLGDSNGW